LKHSGCILVPKGHNLVCEGSPSCNKRKILLRVQFNWYLPKTLSQIQFCEKQRSS
jgi:hypothetical protein